MTFRECKKIAPPGIQIAKREFLSTPVPVADDRVIIHDSEDKLQLPSNRLTQLCDTYNLRKINIIAKVQDPYPFIGI